jgi:hypothetical protein
MTGQTCDGMACCLPQCQGKECGPDGCHGLCGACTSGSCFEGTCHNGPGCAESFEPGCQGCACESCVASLDLYCTTVAWDTNCVSLCLGECGGCAALELCGDGTCDTQEGETCLGCPADCGCAQGFHCTVSGCEPIPCLPDCTGKSCGDDGCQGSCGTCPGDQDSCQQGQCVCLPHCQNLECGPDGCGSSCGTCTGAQETCVNGACQCIPQCDGMQCGDNGCGGTCGTCDGNPDICSDGTCHFGQDVQELDLPNADAPTQDSQPRDNTHDGLADQRPAQETAPGECSAADCEPDGPRPSSSGGCATRRAGAPLNTAGSLTLALGLLALLCALRRRRANAGR